MSDSDGDSARVSIVTLGCARNDVDSDELMGRLVREGFTPVADEEAADVVLVNTCGFIASAKKDSIDAILEAADSSARVVVTGCLAERYGEELAASLPEAAAVLSFDDYDRIGDRVRSVLRGEHLPAHRPDDRRKLLPIAPVDRVSASFSGPARLRLGEGPTESVKLASGCDRRCSFCAIPSFRGAFVSRPADDIFGEVRDLAGQGVREVVLVSENSTSYGKDLGDIRLLETLLPRLAEVPGIVRVRVSYLQPAEMRPGLVHAIASTPGIAAYFDLSFQHASPSVLRRMRRFGGEDDFLALIGSVREAEPRAGIRSNVIVGFPGETEADLETLMRFLGRARLDAVGVFGYSDEDGTEAATLDGHLPEEEVRRRVELVAGLVAELVPARAEERVGEPVAVLVEGEEDGASVGRAAHQGPEDGVTLLHEWGLRPGDLVHAIVRDAQGPDLLAEPL